MVDVLQRRQRTLQELFSGAVLLDDSVSREKALEDMKEAARECERCNLRKGRRQVVFGAGSAHARLMLVGEGPGADEDQMGEPFVGRAGQLLDRILEAVSLKRQDIYITNVVKCRPPGNRTPESEEVRACRPLLDGQIELINPRIILCLGALATRTLIDGEAKITRMRGKWFGKDGRQLMGTFHPAALLRDPSKKKPVWLDFQEVLKQYSCL